MIANFTTWLNKLLINKKNMCIMKYPNNFFNIPFTEIFHTVWV